MVRQRSHMLMRCRQYDAKHAVEQAKDDRTISTKRLLARREKPYAVIYRDRTEEGRVKW